MSRLLKDQFSTFSKDDPRSNPITFWKRAACHALIVSLWAGTATRAQNQGNDQQGQNQGQGQGQNGNGQGRGPNIVDVGGPLTPGFARPPLLVNVQPGQTGSYTPVQIRHAYGFDQLTADGTGQTIGIVDAYGNASIQSDLNTFCTQFGLATTTVRVVGTTGRNTGWALETALDVEWAHVIAPKANIILSVARSASINDLLSAVNAAVAAGANVISMSWGASEFAGEASYETYFQHPGVTYVASSGDNGELTGSVEVEWPAVSPSVLSVGGTSLYTDASGNYVSETAWSSSGGGLSHYFGLPSWQINWNTWSVNQRGVPDVSYVADPNTGVQVYDSVNGGWWIVGGTSAGAPQWAALIALANQARSSGLSGNANIYSAAGTSGAINPLNLHDITSGSNGSDSDDLASVGYDLVTGLGSPSASGVVTALAGGAPAQPDFTISASPSSQTVRHGNSTSYTVTVGSTGGFNGAVNLSVSGLGSGATGSFSPGSISGSRSSTLRITTSGGASRGTATLTIKGTSGSLSHTCTVSLTVN